MSWNNDNRGRMPSDHTTSGGSKRKDSSGYSWNNYTGTKVSHDVQADQLNSKDYSGNHTFYSPKSGRQGVAGGNRDK